MQSSVSSQGGHQDESTEQAYSDNSVRGKISKCWEPRDILYGKIPFIS